MRRFFVVGDTHGQKGLAHDISRVAAKHLCDSVIQLGDFGFGWRTGIKGNDLWLTEVAEAAAFHGVHWYFIDGNHDNHPKLWVTEMPEHVTYMARGAKLVVGNDTIGFMGGAVSVDKGGRNAYLDWWPTEEITYADVNKALDTWDDVSVVLTHDAPTAFPCLPDPDDDFWPAHIIEQARAHRRNFDPILEAIKPKFWIHGHYHYRYTARIDSTIAIGLHNSDNDVSWNNGDFSTDENGDWSFAKSAVILEIGSDGPVVRTLQ